MTPSSARYETEGPLRRMSSPTVTRVPSASMSSGRDSCFLRGDVVVHDLVRSGNPGPGYYEINAQSGALTDRSARISRAVRRTESWAHYECAKGVPTPGPQDYVGPEEYAAPSSYMERSSSHDMSRSSLYSSRRSPRSSRPDLERRARMSPSDDSVRSETATTHTMANGYTPQSQPRDDMLNGTPRSSNTPTPVRHLHATYHQPTISSETKRQTATKMHPRA
jgi:hypothetical protein